MQPCEVYDRYCHVDPHEFVKYYACFEDAVDELLCAWLESGADVAPTDKPSIMDYLENYDWVA